MSYYVLDGLTDMFAVDDLGRETLGRLEHAVAHGGYLSREEAQKVADAWTAKYRSGRSSEESFRVITGEEACVTGDAVSDGAVPLCVFPSVLRREDLADFIDTTDGWTEPKVGVINGQKFIFKHGRNTCNAHVINEFKACEFLRQCGLNVPAARLYNLDGEDVLLLQYIENVRSLEWETRGGVVEGEIRDQLMLTYGVIALMAGFDTYNNGNVLWDGSRLWFVDNGSSFQWRATGGQKKPEHYLARIDPESPDNGIMSLWKFQNRNVLRRCLPTLELEDVLRGLGQTNFSGAIDALDGACKSPAVEAFSSKLSDLS